MSQSAILRASYEAIYQELLNLGGKNKLFLVADGGTDLTDAGMKPTVCLGVSDVSQLCSDKNGQKAEADEMTFEAPTLVGCMLFLTVIAKTYPSLLETIGLLIQHFKDNNAIQLGEYKWHGEDEGKIFIEPVIRETEPQKEPKFHNMPTITLEFRMEMGINSLKGTPFKRVEKRTFKGNIIDK